jgi:hypothetical protein
MGMSSVLEPSMPRLVIGFFGVLVALWTLLCLGLLAAFGFGSEMMRVVTEWLVGTDAEGAFGFLEAAGASAVFVVWLIGTGALGFVGWMMARATREGVVVYTATYGRRSWDDPPMKDVTPPRDARDRHPPGLPRR